MRRPVIAPELRTQPGVEEEEGDGVDGAVYVRHALEEDVRRDEGVRRRVDHVVHLQEVEHEVRAPAAQERCSHKGNKR